MYTVNSTKQRLEQGLALKDKNKDKDLTFKEKNNERTCTTRTT